MSETRFDVYSTEQLGSTAPGASGAHKVGIAPIDGLNASQAWEALRILTQRINSGNADPATVAALGVVLLSVAPADPAKPRVVGDNDRRVNPLTVADFFAFKATTQSLPAQVDPPTAISFDSESWDTGNNFASSAFTAPVAGRYRFGGQALITGNASGTSLFLSLTVDGAALTLIGGNHAASDRSLIASGSRPVRLQAGQVVRLAAAYNQVVGQPAATIQPTNTFFYGRYEGHDDSYPADWR